MADRVLVPVDTSEHARHAVTLALDEFPGAAIMLLHVIDPGEAGFTAGASLPAFSEDWYAEAEADAEELLEDYAADVSGRGVEVDWAIKVGRPTRVIVEFAESEDVDHIVIGSHGREGITRVLLGSVAEAVVRRSPVPVTVTR
ncbi:MAG: universal stress protein [Salinirussus sp.]